MGENNNAYKITCKEQNLKRLPSEYKKEDFDKTTHFGLMPVNTKDVLPRSNAPKRGKQEPTLLMVIQRGVAETLQSGGGDLPAGSAGGLREKGQRRRGGVGKLCL